MCPHWAEARVCFLLFYVPSRLFHKNMGAQCSCMSLGFFLLVGMNKNAWNLYTYRGNSLSLYMDLVCPPIRYGDPSESLFSVGGILYQKEPSANKVSPDTGPEIAMDMI